MENIIDRKKSEQPFNLEKAKMSQINDYLYLGELMKLKKKYTRTEFWEIR